MRTDIIAAKTLLPPLSILRKRSRFDRRGVAGLSGSFDRKMKAVDMTLTLPGNSSKDANGGEKSNKKVRTYFTARKIGSRLAVYGLIAEGLIKGATVATPELSGEFHLGLAWAISSYVMDSGIAINLLANYLQANDFSVHKRLHRLHSAEIALKGMLYDVFVKPVVKLRYRIGGAAHRAHKVYKRIGDTELTINIETGNTDAAILDNLW